MEILTQLFGLVIGMTLLIKGADWFVEGSSSIAKSLKIPSLIIGLTLVSIGTSLPELGVSLSASLAGSNDISLGNVIGSDIFNTFVVIGASALFVPLTVSKDMKKFDLPIYMGLALLLGLFAFIITPGKLDTVESVIIFSLFFVYTVHLIVRSKKNGAEEEEITSNGKAWYINALMALLGVGCIIYGADVVVEAAKFIAAKAGMNENLVGLTVVAVGTSLPELVTSIVAAKKGEHDIAVGNAIGSDIFNIILILGLTSTISPATVGMAYVADFGFMLLSGIMIFLMSAKKMKISKTNGIILIATYAVYLAFIIIRFLKFGI